MPEFCLAAATLYLLTGLVYYWQEAESYRDYKAVDGSAEFTLGARLLIVSLWPLVWFMENMIAWANQMDEEDADQ